MFCTNCGKEVSDTSAVCPHCGNIIKAKESNSEQIISHTERVKPKSKRVTVIAAIIAVAVAAVVAVILLTRPGAVAAAPVTMNLDEYVTVEFSGINGYGEARVLVDEERLVADYKDKIVFNENGIRELLEEREGRKVSGDEVQKYIDELGGTESFIREIVPKGILVDTIVFTLVYLDRDENLSNGDVVKVQWPFDESTSETYGKISNLQLEYSEATFTVEGLQEAKKVDIFEGLEVSFDGTAPNGMAFISGTPAQNYASSLEYVIEKSEGLSEGEEITVSVRPSSGGNLSDYLSSNYGVVPDATEKKYVVEGLSQYIASVEQVPEDVMERMKKQAEDVFVTQVLEDYKSISPEVEKQAFIGTYLLSLKEGRESTEFQNRMIVVYKEIVDSNKNSPMEMYNFITWDNITKNTNQDVIIDINGYGVCNNRILLRPWLNVHLKGYGDLDELKKNEVLRYVEAYAYEDRVLDVNLWEPVTSDVETSEEVAENNDGEVQGDKEEEQDGN